MQRFYRYLGVLVFATYSILLSSLTSAQQAESVATSMKDEESRLKLTARYYLEKGSDKGFLIVKAKIPKGSYIYSLNQSSPLIPTKLTFKNDHRVSALSGFQPDKKPKVIPNDPIFETRLEKHYGTVQFYVPIQLADTSSLNSYKPTVLLNGQICAEEGFCQPIRSVAVEAIFSGFFRRQARKSVDGFKRK